MNNKTFDGGLTWVILTVMLGCLLCFAGYRLWRFSAVAIAFVTGAALLADGLLMGLAFMAMIYPLVHWSMYLVFGCVAGFMAAMSPGFGVYLVGFSSGVQIANMIMALLTYNGSVVACFMCLVGVGMVFGVLTLKFQKPALVVATSLLGAVTILSGVSYWVDASLYSMPLFQEAANAEIANWTYFVFFLVVEPSFFRESMAIQISSWTLLLVLLGLFAIGSLVQFKVTGKGTYHGDEAAWCGRGGAHEQHRQANDETVARMARYENLESPQEMKRFQTGEDPKNLQVVDPAVHV